MDFYGGLKAIKTWHFPLHLAKTACGVGARLETIGSFSKEAKKRIRWSCGPFQGVAFAVYGMDALSSEGQKAVQMGLALIRKGCEIVLWADWARFFKATPYFLHRVAEVRLITSLAKSSFKLWCELCAEPAERDLWVSIPKFLKSSLLCISYMTDNKKVKLAAKVFGYVRDGSVAYRLYQNHRWKWRADTLQVCKVISLTSLSFYVIERNVNFDILK